jgi:AcrR family transcriptional regulator
MTHQKIVNASIKVFAEKGFEAASLDEIARVASIGKGTIYYHYASKEDLYCGIIDLAFEQLYADQVDFIGSESTLEQYLRDRVVQDISFAEKHPDIFKMIFRGMTHFERSMGDRIRGSLYKYAIVEMDRLHELRLIPFKPDSETEKIFYMIRAIVDSRILHWLMKGQAESMGTDVENLVGMILGGLERIWKRRQSEIKTPEY